MEATKCLSLASAAAKIGQPPRIFRGAPKACHSGGPVFAPGIDGTAQRIKLDMNFKLAILSAATLLAASAAFSQPLPNNFWPNSTFSSGTNLGQPNGIPTGWIQNGSLGTLTSLGIIDQMTNASLPDSSYAIMVINTNSLDNAYGEWDCAVPLAGVANPGDTIDVRYDLMWSVQDSQMRVAVGFLDAGSNYISADQFVLNPGDSPGWNGGFDSTFTETNQTAVVPVGAVYLNIGVVSAGALGTTGVLIVDDIYAARAPTPDLLSSNFWPNPSFESGTNLDQTNGIPTGWNVYNSSSNSYITQVTTNNYVSADHAIVVVDNDPDNYGSWYSDLLSLSGVAKPGDSLNLQWFQLYSVSNGEMRVTFSFYNSGGSDIDDISFQVTGNSPGWQGAVAGSGFSQVNQQVLVPPDATQLLVQLVSGGSVQTTGIMMIDDLSIAPPQTLAILPGNFWPNSSFTKGLNLNRSTGTPTGWVRGGSSSNIDQVASFNNATTYALAVIDNQTNQYGEWDGDLALSSTNAAPGNLVDIQYYEVYSVTNGPMRLSVLFFDVNSNTLSQTDYNVTGNSTGWTGVISNSTFTVVSNQVLVPANSVRMRFALVSGGPEAATGLLLIKNLSAAVQFVPPIPGTVLAGNFFPNPTFEQGADLDNPMLGLPAGGWLRGGSSPTMDQVTTNNWTSPTHSLELMDNDVNNYGEWYLIFNLAGLATNGDALDIQWYQLYNVTNGQMRLTFEFFDTNNNNLETQNYLTSDFGTNNGWEGTVGPPSTFDMEFQRLELPAGAAVLQVHFASGGSEAVTGVFLIDDLSVRLSPPNFTDVEPQPGGGINLTWNSMASKNYTVLFSGTLSAPPSTWTVLATNLPGAFPTTSYFDPVNHGPGNGFYLIEQQ
jgi:hypothetical protein